MRPHFLRRAVVACLLAGLLVAPAAGPVRAGEDLPPKYKEWLNQDVAYIITRTEKNAFLKLKDNDARDKFVDHFWEVRNPTPGAPSNPYREEHYRRLAYANDHFGHESGTPGWRTDQGRIYILLGPPQQMAVYRSYGDIWPTETWFYASTHPALPPAFYIVFYQRDGHGPYRFYSPYFDGPEKLVTYRGDTRLQALRAIGRGVSHELARISLSLLPDEPVDVTTGIASLQSDVMLSTLQDLANNPFSIEQLNLRQLGTNVRAALLFQGDTLGVLTVPLRDAAGNTRLEYLLRFSRPEDFTLAESTGDRFYFNIGVRVQVFGPDNRLIFTQERTLSRYVDQTQVERVKSKIFGYEDWLPLPPGKYRLELQLTNWLKKASYRTERTVVLPEPSSKGLQIPEIVPYVTAFNVQSADAGFAPFSVGGVKFTPLLKRDMNLSPGKDLKFFYQIWAPPGDPISYRGQKLEAEYAYGRPGVALDAKVVRDEVPKELFDVHGSLVNGKEMPIGDWPSGNYQLTLTLTDPATNGKTYSTLGFRLLPSDPGGSFWDVYDGDAISGDIKSGLMEYQRALCYLAQDKKQQAGEWFYRALAKNPSREDARTALVDLDFSREAFGDIADLANRFAITDKTEERTILRMAESLDKTSQTRRAIQLLESALSLKAASGPLYLTLASYYQRLGDAPKAEELERKGKLLMSSRSPSS